MTKDADHDDTPPEDWDETEELDDEASEELERLQANLGLAPGAKPRLIDGRYEILGRRGQGGMGVVYQAHDTRLDRDVALKLVRSRPFRDEDRLRERLEREAKSLARLDGRDHVVAVYDVGRHRDRIYFTMPYIQGLDLREWQDLEPRSVEEIIDVYLQAARGLWEAHELGIVHRDFKPGNVLVRDDDHRILVADFGIAEATSKLDTPPEGIDDTPEQASRLTSTGAVLGTLPYVAPERLPSLERPPLRGSIASDQFSFCVALWEALAGQVPFEADSPAQMLAALERQPAGQAQIPGWLRPLLRRGLSQDPDARFPSMADLSRAIERRRHRLHRVAIISGGSILALALLVAALVLWTSGHGHAEARVACSSFSDTATQIWSDERRLALAEQRHYAPETIDHVIAQLDELMRRWVAAGEETCVDGYAPAPDDARLECLNQWRDVATDYIGLLTEIDDPRAAARAGEFVDRLLPPPRSFCVFSPPAVVDFGVWSTTEAARAAAVLGLEDRAIELATSAVEQARALADGRPHTAEFADAYAARAEVFTRQRQWDAALRDFAEADTHAHVTGYLEREISNQALWAKVRALSGAQALDYEKALEDIERKRSLVAVVAVPERRTRLEAELEEAAGFVEYRRDGYLEAIAHHGRAVELLSRVAQPVLLAKTLNNLGSAHKMLEHWDQAREAYQGARRALDDAGVPLAHSTSIEVELNLGILDVELDRSQGFDHLASVARLSSGVRQLEALDQALTLAMNLDDEQRLPELAEQLFARVSSTPLETPLQIRAKFGAATAFIHLGDPRGDKLFAALPELSAERLSPALGLGLRQSHVRALEERGRCQDAATALAELDDYALQHALADAGFRQWRIKRETSTCELTPFPNSNERK